MSPQPILKHLRGTLVQVNVPHWFADPAFQAWLNDEEPKMTWHRGGKPHEHSDVLVMVSPELSGEGTHSDMPHHDELVAYLKAKGLTDTGGLHVGVWLTNLEA